MIPVNDETAKKLPFEYKNNCLVYDDKSSIKYYEIPNEIYKYINSIAFQINNAKKIDNPEENKIDIKYWDDENTEEGAK